MQLPLSVSFRDFEGTPELEAYAAAEAAKLERYFTPIMSCRVIVERPQRAPSGAVYHVRIDLGVPQGELVVRHDPSIHGAQQDLQTERTHAEAKATRLHIDPKRAIHEAFREMRRQLQDHARKIRGDVKRTRAALARGRVSQLFPEPGYGFIAASDGHDVYFHKDSVLQGKFDRLRVGSDVAYAEEPGEKGPQASTVRIRHPRKQVTGAAASVVVNPAKRAVASVAKR